MKKYGCRGSAPDCEGTGKKPTPKPVHIESRMAEVSAEAAGVVGSGRKPRLLPPQLGCWIAAPLVPHPVQRAHCQQPVARYVGAPADHGDGARERRFAQALVTVHPNPRRQRAADRQVSP